MFGSRKNRPGLIGTAVRTAVIVKTANAVSGNNRRAQPAPAPQVVHVAAPVAAAPTGLSSEAMAQLQQLAELRTSGILTDEEFATQKARILG